ncbi:twin-arginine translocase TatA/TatE family subunit [Glycomyces arizonensis]|uniref:twin-arginine translocase TatA/TatE family subunit n=1 Tax=Glycomyces arizonensis TaxID=256035 RepID=UPI00041725D4|nr:twin-arginine translocase TatA/TatE family subunit [Glycomyces arizonensis]
MFGGFGGLEFLVIILIAIFLWGPDKLPEALRNLRRFISKARNMASNAAADLSREIGTDIKPEDLNPKTFVRKHILSEEDQEMLTNPLKATMKDLQEGTKPLKEDLDEATRGIEDTRRAVNGRRPRGSASRAVTGDTAAGGASETGGGRAASRYDDAT